MTPTNPKKAFGDKKPELDQLSLAGMLAWWEAAQDGSNKYGFYNYRESPVEARTYINAAIRHLQLFANGEEHTRDTGVQNLGAVMACCSILIDAAAHGNLIDNRVKSEVNCDLLQKAEEMVVKLREAQESRDKADTKEFNWVRYYGSPPDLRGYRNIRLRFEVPAGEGKFEYYEPEVEVDPRQLNYGSDWHGVHSWRPA